MGISTKVLIHYSLSGRIFIEATINVTSHHSANAVARMTIDILTELVPIPCTERDKLSKLRTLLIDIQSAWFGNSFGSGETFSTPEIWEKMQEAVCLMQRQDDPSKKGIDLKAIASNYELLERIFIARHWETNGYVLDDSSFVGCDLIQMHRFSALGILRKVDALHQSILLAKKKELSLKDLKQKLLDAIADDDLGEVSRLLSDNDKQQGIWEEAKSYPDEDDRSEKDGGSDESPASKFMTELHKFTNFDQSDWQALEEVIADPKTQIIDEDGERSIEQRVVDSYSDDTELWKINNARREMGIDVLWRLPDGSLVPEGCSSNEEYMISLKDDDGEIE